MILFRLAIARVLPIIVNRRPRRLIPTGISLCLWSPWKFTSPSTSAYSINTLAYTYIYIYVYPGFKRSFSRPDLWSKIVRSVIKVLSLGRKFCPSLSLSLSFASFSVILRIIPLFFLTFRKILPLPEFIYCWRNKPSLFLFDDGSTYARYSNAISKTGSGRSDPSITFYCISHPYFPIFTVRGLPRITITTSCKLR